MQDEEFKWATRTHLDKTESSAGIPSAWWCSADGRTQSVRYSTSLFLSFTSWWSNNSSLLAITCHQHHYKPSTILPKQTCNCSLSITPIKKPIAKFEVSSNTHPFQILFQRLPSSVPYISLADWTANSTRSKFFFGCSNGWDHPLASRSFWTFNGYPLLYVIEWEVTFVSTSLHVFAIDNCWDNNCLL